MFKNFMWAVAAFAAATSLAFAAVEVNTADQSQLESVKGIGPGTAKKIIDERKKAPFKDWNDLTTRVNGIGATNSAKLSDAGLTVNSQSNTATAGSMKSDMKKGASTAKAKTESAMSNTKSDVKADTSKAKAKTESATDNAKAEVKSGASKVYTKSGEIKDSVKADVKSGASKVYTKTGEAKDAVKDEVKSDASKTKKKAGEIKDDGMNK